MKPITVFFSLSFVCIIFLYQILRNRDSNYNFLDLCCMLSKSYLAFLQEKYVYFLIKEETCKKPLQFSGKNRIHNAKGRIRDQKQCLVWVAFHQVREKDEGFRLQIGWGKNLLNKRTTKKTKLSGQTLSASINPSPTENSYSRLGVSWEYLLLIDCRLSLLRALGRWCFERSADHIQNHKAGWCAWGLTVNQTVLNTSPEFTYLFLSTTTPFYK